MLTLSSRAGLRKAAVGLLVIVICFAAGLRWAMAQSSVQLSFQLTTAAEAAVGAPVGYTITITNTGSATLNLTGKVNLVAPNGTIYNIWTSTVNQSYSPGASRTKSGTFISSTYTSATGTFTLTGSVTDSTGASQGQTSYAVNVISVPANGIYGNVGGVGPDSQLLGMRYDFSTVVANLSSSSMSLKTKTTLISPDGTQSVFNAGILTTFGAGASAVASGTLTTSQYNNQTGTFGVRVDVLDGSNTVLATETHNFVRNPLPVSYYPPTFTDTTASTVLNKMNMAPMMGSCMSMFGQGASAGDYDGDGKTDLFVTDGKMGGYLYHGNGDGTFTDVSSTALPMTVAMAMGAAASNFVDYDNDGHPDIFIVVSGGMNVLLHNNGDGTFTDVSSTSGLQGTMPNGYSGATWGDYDGDGYLDVYITNHGDCNHSNSGDLLFHNNGNGTFTNVTNLLQTTGTGINGLGLAALFFDYNGDGRPDIYVGNDIGGSFGANVLWKNMGSNGMGGWNNFSDVSKATNMGIAMSQMGIAIGDYNRDGFFDLFLSNQRNNKLMRGSASGSFTEVATAANVAHATTPTVGGSTSSVTWGDVFMDFNNDGWEDLAIGSGSMGAKVKIPNILYLNNMDGTFLDLSLMSGIQAPAMAARTVVAADFNGDGFPDLFITAMDDFPHLFINNGRSNGNPYNYLRVKLVGSCLSCAVNSGKSNRDAVGAKLVASIGGAQLLRTVYNGGTFEGSSDLTVHFGLGSATQVDTLTITWPSGKVQTLTNVQANQVLTVSE